MSQTYKKQGIEGLFGKQYRLKKLSNQGDPLEKLNQVNDWSVFLPTLEKTQNTDKKSHAGAKPYNPILMFKILILQRYYNLSDEETEYQILDRPSFCRFLGLSLDDKVPDAKTIWNFRVEHVFGFMAGSMNQLYARPVGAKRIEGVIGLINLTYNLFRVEQLVRLQGISVPMAERI